MVTGLPGLTPFSMSNASSPACLPFATRSWRTVVSGGSDQLAAGVSSKPTIDTSAGTASPSSLAARMAPSASSSDMQSTAVGLGSSPSNQLAPSLPNSRTLPGASQMGTSSATV